MCALVSHADELVEDGAARLAFERIIPKVDPLLAGGHPDPLCAHPPSRLAHNRNGAFCSMQSSMTLKNQRLRPEAARVHLASEVSKDGRASNGMCGIVRAARSIGQATGSRILAGIDSHNLAHGHGVQASANG